MPKATFIRYFLFVLITLSQAAVAQTKYTGKIVDAATNTPLPFVNVGIVGQNIGTVTDEQGRFTIPLSYQYGSDSFKISIIGYESKSWLVENRLDNLGDSIIKLQPANYEITEVEVNNKRLKSKTIGSTTTSPFFAGGFTSNDLGNEVCVKINVGKKTVLLDKFNFNIASNNCDSLLFRVNVYRIKDGLPGDNLLKESVYVVTSITSGLVTVDLSPYSLWLSDDFAIGVEYIKPCPERALLFSAAFLGSIYSRTTSQGNWEKLKGFDLGFNVEVKY